MFLTVLWILNIIFYGKITDVATIDKMDKLYIYIVA